MPSQWETPLLCNNVYHWPGASLVSALQTTLGLVEYTSNIKYWEITAVLKIINWPSKQSITLPAWRTLKEISNLIHPDEHFPVTFSNRNYEWPKITTIYMIPHKMQKYFCHIAPNFELKCQGFHLQPPTLSETPFSPMLGNSTVGSHYEYCCPRNPHKPRYMMVNFHEIPFHFRPTVWRSWGPTIWGIIDIITDPLCG